MKGLELARGFYEEYGAPMIHREFPEWEGVIAVGLVGAGSECFGFDDALSRDHDFEPGFCMFIPDESIIDSRLAFRMERAYAKLPKEYGGVKRLLLQPVGGARHGVIRTADFYEARLGTKRQFLTNRDWLTVPEHYLAEATNGAVFRDDAGEFTRMRRMLTDMPRDIRRKKMAGHLLLMAQSGQYNYMRCIRHGEQAAAQLAVFEFVQHTLGVLFLLNKTYMPFYKWAFRALRNLPVLSEMAPVLEMLLTTGNDEKTAVQKQAAIEEITRAVTEELRKQGYSDESSPDLERQAYAVNDGIEDAVLRNENILCAV